MVRREFEEMVIAKRPTYFTQNHQATLYRLPNGWVGVC